MDSLHFGSSIDHCRQDVWLFCRSAGWACSAKLFIIPAFGFILEMDGKKIGYTGDTEKYEGMEEAYDGCDLLILNAMKPDEDQYKGHLTSEEASALIGRIQPKLAVLTHMGMKMQQYPAEKKAQEIEEETGVKTVAALDGMRISSEQF